MEVEIKVGQEFKRQFKQLAKKYHSLPSDFSVWKKNIQQIGRAHV